MTLTSLLARRFDAHLTGVALETAADVAERFDTMLVQDQLTGNLRVTSGPAAAFVTRLAAAADLLVLGQREPDRSTGLDAPEEVVLGCGRPVLIVPYGKRIETLGERVLIGWNGGSQAAGALHDALPLMTQSHDVLIAQVDPPFVAPASDDQGTQADEVAFHLQRHGLNARAETITSVSLDTAETLLSRAKDFGADLLVIGAYQHSRLRELLLGGVTHDILRNAELPVLMSH
jgi:nucleotide-binding universal stress UspA family protein